MPLVPDPRCRRRERTHSAASPAPGRALPGVASTPYPLRVTLDLLRWGGERLRIGAWRGDAHVAYVAPLAGTPSPTADIVGRSCAVLAERGYVEVITAALGPVEAQGFVAAGFEIRERLHLLDHDLGDLRPMAAVELRRARRTDRADVLAIDRRAFSRFWHLEEVGLAEALTATPSTRFRVAAPGSTIARGGRLEGYAVSGRAGRRGFLQRLAVEPADRGRGVGTALVLDALYWMRRRGVDRAVVNTQESNQAALALYESVGFRRQRDGLAVLRTTL